MVTDRLRLHACSDCGLVHRAPHPTVPCACGHPIEVHHRTDSGRMTYCTVWSSPAPLTPATQCGCKRAELLG